MRTFKFTLLAVLSYVAVMGATPLENRAPAVAIDRRQEYVPLTTALGGSDPFENIYPAQSALRISALELKSARLSALDNLLRWSAWGSAPKTLRSMSVMSVLQNSQLPVCKGFCDNHPRYPSCEPNFSSKNATAMECLPIHRSVDHRTPSWSCEV